MRKFLPFILCLMMTPLFASCAATAEERTGEAQGYGGTLKVTVTMDGDTLSKVTVTEHHETEGVGTKAIDALPAAIVSAGSADVDTVSGATVTSRAIMAAVRDAMGDTSGSAAPSPSIEPTDPPPADPSTLPDGAMTGIGMTAVGRIGPGKDDTDAQVYSFNVTFACAAFDPDGKILSVKVDTLEVATPNYDGATMPHFSGFPGQGGYNLWDDDAGKVSGKTADTEEAFLEEIADWQTKRDRGDAYQLTGGTWASQMDAYEQMFVGKTVADIEEWYKTYFSASTGRPLTEGSEQTGDAEQYAALTDEQKGHLTDVTSSATMSLQDAHGDIIGALRKAWENAQGA